MLSMDLQTVLERLEKDSIIIQEICCKVRYWKNALLYGDIIIITNSMVFLFDSEHRLFEIGVTYGFEGLIEDKIGIGGTLYDVIDVYGDFDDSDELMCFIYPSQTQGIRFLLGDYDDPDDQWDEMKAPIEWIFVFKED